MPQLFSIVRWPIQREVNQVRCQSDREGVGSNRIGKDCMEDGKTRVFNHSGLQGLQKAALPVQEFRLAA